MKTALNAFAKGIDTCQPVQSTQADMGRNFSRSLINVLHVKRPFLNLVVCLTIGNCLVGGMNHGDALTLYQMTKFVTVFKLKAIAGDTLTLYQMTKF